MGDADLRRDVQRGSRLTPREPLGRALDTPEGKRAYVRGLFATIADRYDFITRALSFNRDAAWKRRLVALSGAGPTTRALDLACGTGDIAFATAARGASVIGLDLTLRMVQLARLRDFAASAGKPRLASGASRPSFVTGDMLALPFPDASFDLVTTGYGIRNVPTIPPAIAEIHRVLRSGGLVLSLDFNRPDFAPLRAVYLAYLTVVGSALGWVLHRDPDTYRYIPESIRRYPGASRVAATMASAGFEDCRVLPVLGGLMAINTARKR